jgi:ribosome-binding factor A
MPTRRPFKRTDRLSREILRSLATAMRSETREEILHQVVLMDVEVTRDLSYARVYLFVEEDQQAEVREALGRAQGFLRSSVSKKIRMRHAPELRFLFDNSLDRAGRIEGILSDLDIPGDGDGTALVEEPGDGPT